MQSGRLIHRVIVKRFSGEQDAYGEETGEWAEIGSRLSQVFFGKGAERREAAMTRASQSATFRLRVDVLTRSITVRDRLSYEGCDWDISGIAQDTPQSGEIEITAIRAV